MWNARDNKSKRLQIGSDNVMITPNHPSKELRYLGIYIRSHAGQHHTITRIKNKSDSLYYMIKHKQLTAAQIICTQQNLTSVN